MWNMVLRNSSLRAGEAASHAVTLAAKPDGLSSTLSMVKKKKIDSCGGVL